MTAHRSMGGLRVLALALLALPPWAPAASAASFDCANAKTPDEEAVCSDPRLSALDDLVGRGYAQVKRAADRSERPRLLSDARAFMARRSRCGADAACLTAAYAGMIADLGADGSSVQLPASVSALQMTPVVPAETRDLPAREGGCATTRIDKLTGRLEGDPNFASGVSVQFANGGTQVSYEAIPAVTRSRPGDRALVCLTSIPKHCPPGDDRGRMYTTTNLRTQATWSLPDSEHQCGGA